MRNTIDELSEERILGKYAITVWDRKIEDYTAIGGLAALAVILRTKIAGYGYRLFGIAPYLAERGRYIWVD